MTIFSRQRLVGLVAALALTTADAALAQSRVPDANWPVWSPFETTHMARGLQTPDEQGCFPQSAIGDLGAAGFNVYLPKNTYAGRALDGLTDKHTSEVAVTSSALAIEDSQLLKLSSGELRLYFRVRESFEGREPWLALYTTNKPVGGAWTTPVSISTFSKTTGIAGPPGPVLQTMWEEEVVNFAASLDASGSPKVFYEQRRAWYDSVTGAPYKTRTYVCSASTSPGVVITPEYVNEDPSAGLACYQGQALRSIRVADSAPAVYDLISYPATGAPVVLRTGPDPMQVHYCGLYISADGLIKFYTWTEGTTPSVKHMRSDDLIVETWGDGIDGAVFTDSNSVLHRFWVGPAGSGALHHSIKNAGWSDDVISSTVNSTFKSLGRDDLDRFYVSGSDGSDERTTRMWDPNLGLQVGPSMIGVAPGTSFNSASGNLTIAVPLFETEGSGPQVSLSLFYNSYSTANDVSGKGWSHSYNFTIQSGFDFDGEPGYFLNYPDGSRIFLAFDATAAGFVPLSEFGESLRLSVVSGQIDGALYKLESINGVTWFFGGDGRPTRVEDRDAQALHFHYGSSGALLDHVTDSHGRSTVFHYNSNGRLDTICDPGGAEFSLFYDAARPSLLTQVKLPGPTSAPPRIWRFAYYIETISYAVAGYGAVGGMRDRVLSFRTPNLATDGAARKEYQFGYLNSGEHIGRVNVVVDPEVDLTRHFARLEYSSAAIVLSGTIGFETTYTDREAREFIIANEYRRNLPLRLVDELHGATKPTVFSYDSRRNAIATTDPGGRRVEHTLVDSNELLSPWVKDLVKSITLPGDSLGTTFEYHSTWNTVTKVIPLTGTSEATNITYDARGHTSGILKPGDANPIVLEWDAAGQLTRIIDQLSKTTSISYAETSNGLPTTIQVDGIVDEMGVERPFIYTYNSLGQLLTVQRPSGGTTSYDYDEGHRLISITPPSDAGSGSYTATLDSDGNPTRLSDPNGNGIDLVYDEYGRVTVVTNAAMQSYSRTYTPNGSVSGATTWGGASTTSFEYDSLNRLTFSSMLVNAADDLYLQKLFEYDDSGNIASETVKGNGDRPAPRTTVHHYDSRNLESKTVMPGGDTETRYFYNLKRQPVAQEIWHDSGSGFEFFAGTAWVLDAQGRALKSVQQDATLPASGEPTGRATLLAYDDRGLLTTLTSPMSHAFSYVYDASGRMTQRIDPEGVAEFTKYTADGHIVGKSMAIAGWGGLQTPHTCSYDSRGQLTHFSDNINPLDNYTNAFDNAGRLTLITGPNDLMRSVGYDSLNRYASSQTRRDSATMLRTDLKYDAAGNLTQIYAAPGDTGGPMWRFEYDAGNRQTKTIAPIAGHEQHFEYDAVGNLTYSRDEDHNEVHHTYDVRDRLVASTYTKGPLATTWETTTRTYDCVGNLLSLDSTSSGVHVDYQYKPNSPAVDPHTQELRLVTWRLAGAPWKYIEHEYDADGRRILTRVRNSLGIVTFTLFFSYDDSGRPLSSASAEFEYTHGFLTRTILGNGNEIKRFYDKKGRLDRLEQLTNDGSVLASIRYAYDGRDRKIEVYYAHYDLRSTCSYTDNSWLSGESYDFNVGGPSYFNSESTALGGNESVDSSVASCVVGGGIGGTDRSVSYSYDLRGNRLTKDISGSTVEDRSYSYDEEDRLVTESTPSGDPLVSYEYAGRGDLTKRTVIGGPVSNYYSDYLGRITSYSSPTASWHYLYAPTGDRIAKTNIGAPGVNEWYLPNDCDTIADYHKPSAMPEEFTGLYLSLGADNRIARVDSVGVASYFFADALGSVHQVSNALGAVIHSQFTDAWGNDYPLGVPSPPSGPGDRYGFQGRETDSESGLQFFRARSYDPLTGRFTSRDPIWHANNYLFVDNDPANRIDPLGLDSLQWEGNNVYWVSEEKGMPRRTVWLGTYSEGEGKVKLSGFKQTNIDARVLGGHARDFRAGFGNTTEEAMRGLISLKLGGVVKTVQEKPFEKGLGDGLTVFGEKSTQGLEFAVEWYLGGVAFKGVGRAGGWLLGKAFAKRAAAEAAAVALAKAGAGKILVEAGGTSIKWFTVEGVLLKEFKDIAAMKAWALANGVLLEGHHLLPQALVKAMGLNPSLQRLVALMKMDHTGAVGVSESLHNLLFAFEGGIWAPTAGRTAADIVRIHGQDAVIAALRRFYSQPSLRHLLPLFEEAVRVTLAGAKGGN